MGVLEKIQMILNVTAEPHETLYYMSWVTQSIEGCKLSADNMHEHGSLENYCTECIKHAVDSKYKEWTDERNILMGQIFEAKNKGYFTRYGYGEDEKFRFRKIKIAPTQIKQMEIKLSKEYRVGTLFSYETLQLIGYETEGFESCTRCGKMFNTSLLLNDQELEHWECLTDNDYKGLSVRQSYELSAIIYEGSCENHELHSRCEKLAERILPQLAQ